VSELQREWDWKSLFKRFLTVVPAIAISFGVISGLITGDYLLSLGISTVIGCTLFLIFTIDYRWIQPRLKHFPRDRRLVFEILFASIEAMLGFIFAFWVSGLVFGFSIMDTPIWISILIGFGVFLVFRSIRYATQFYRDLKTKELVEEQLKTLAAQAELKALKAQINPHFLFNTLNTIAALTHSDPQKAEATIEKLAELFRYVLVSGERGLVPLSEELSFTNRYLEIERTRFGHNLHITHDVEDSVLGTIVPSLILQPLVENAIRHGQGEDGSINLGIRIASRGEDLVISIADQGPGIPEDFHVGQSKGVGLRNVDERLRKNYGDLCGLNIGPNSPRGALISFRIPLRKMVENSEEVLAGEKDLT
jgi:sensor histidine kinase YesM